MGTQVYKIENKPTPKQIGLIFDESTLLNVANDGFDATNWDVYGNPNPIFTPGNIDLTSSFSGPSYFTKTIVYKKYYSCLENFLWEVDVVINDITDFGVSIGLWYYGNTEYLYQMWLWGSGRMDLWSSANNFITNVPAGSVVIANGDRLRLRIIRIGDTLTINATNLTQGLPPVAKSLIYSFSYPFSYITPETFRPAIGNMGGNNQIKRFNYTSIDMKNIDILLITDSKGVYFQNNYANTILNQLRFNNPGKIIELNGTANQTLWGSILNESEGVLYKAKKVFIFRGCNDYRGGANQATMQLYLTMIKNFHENNESTVYFIESLPEGPGGSAINSTIVNAAASNVFTPSKIVAMYNAFWSGVGTGANPAYFEADLIHPNVTGTYLFNSLIQPYI